MLLAQAILVRWRNATVDSAWMTCANVNVESVGTEVAAVAEVVVVVAVEATVGMTVVLVVAMAGTVTPVGATVVADVLAVALIHVRPLFLAGWYLNCVLI